MGGGAVPAPDARPAGTRRRAGPSPVGPHLGPLAAPPDSSGRGREARAHLRPVASKWETEAERGRRAWPGVTRTVGSQVELEPRPLSPCSSSLAQVGVLPPQDPFSLVLIHSSLRTGLKEGAPLSQGLSEVLGRSLWGPGEEQIEQI